MSEKLALIVFNEFVDMERATALQRFVFALVTPGQGQKCTFLVIFLLSFVHF